MMIKQKKIDNLLSLQLMMMLCCQRMQKVMIGCLLILQNSLVLYHTV